MIRREDARQVLSAAMIACGVCVAAWLFTARPVAAQLEEAEARVRTAREQAKRAVSLETDPDASEARLEEAQRRSALVRDLAARTGDPMALYDRIGALAAEHGVEVDRMRPARVAEKSRGDEFPGDAVGFALTVRGGYEGVARLIGGLERELGFSSCLRWQVAPEWRDGERMVSATIETVHLRIDLARAMAGDAMEDEE